MMNAKPDNPDKRIACELGAFLHAAADREASDVHLVPGYPVTYRVHGRLETAGESVLDGETVHNMIEAILPDRLIPRLHEGKNFDCSLSLDHKGRPCRFRANVYLAEVTSVFTGHKCDQLTVAFAERNLACFVIDGFNDRVNCH